MGGGPTQANSKSEIFAYIGSGWEMFKGQWRCLRANGDV